MKKVYFLLIAAFGVFCLGPLTTQSQARTGSGSGTVAERILEPIAENTVGSIISPGIVAQNQSTSPASGEEMVPATAGEQNSPATGEGNAPAAPENAPAAPEGEAVEAAPSTESSSPAQAESDQPNETQPAAAEPSQPGETQPAAAEPGEAATATVAESYTELEQYLNEKNWREADETTYELMLLIAGPKSAEQGYFDSTEWETFSCDEFRRIDALWSKATEGQQGFTAQLNIYREVNDPTAYYDRIGWKQGDEWLVRWQYNRSSKRAEYVEGKEPNYAQPPAGHLPALMQWGRGLDYRLQKAASCEA